MTGGPLRQVKGAKQRGELVHRNLQHFEVADRVEIVTTTLTDTGECPGAVEPRRCRSLTFHIGKFSLAKLESRV